MSEDPAPYGKGTIILASGNGNEEVPLKRAGNRLIPIGSFIDNDGVFESLRKVVLTDAVSILKKVVDVTWIQYRATCNFELNYGKHSGDKLSLAQLQQRLEDGLAYDFDETNFEASMFLHASREYNNDMQFWTLYITFNCWPEHWYHESSDDVYRIWQFAINKHYCFLDQGYNNLQNNAAAKALYHELESDYFANYQKI